MQCNKSLITSVVVGLSLFSGAMVHAKGCNGVVSQGEWGCAAWDNNNGPQYPHYKKPAAAAQPAGPVAKAPSLAVQKSPVLAPNAGSVVNRNGGNLVAQGGGNLVAQGGGNLVAQGGGNLKK